MPEMEWNAREHGRYIPALEWNALEQGHLVPAQKALLQAQVAVNVKLWQMKQARALRPQQWCPTWWRCWRR